MTETTESKLINRCLRLINLLDSLFQRFSIHLIWFMIQFS
jgi:hypothetical protein